MSAEIVDLRLARARAAVGSSAEDAWNAFVAARCLAERTGSINDMRAAVQAYDAMVVAFEAHDRGTGGRSS